MTLEQALQEAPRSFWGDYRVRLLFRIINRGPRPDIFRMAVTDTGHCYIDWQRNITEVEVDQLEGIFMLLQLETATPLGDWREGWYR